jgi:hypothetical protein
LAVSLGIITYLFINKKWKKTRVYLYFLV